MSNGTLPYTGATSIVVGGLVLESTAIFIIGLALIFVGALCVRFGFRKNKTPKDI